MRHTQELRLYRFIVEFLAEHGRMPTNKDITRGTDVPYWRVSSVLTRLVETGRLTRTQLRDRATKAGPKYSYSIGGEVV